MKLKTNTPVLSPTAQFYAEIQSFDNFSEVANIENYKIAPDDWFVVIADIQGSTRAIAQGRYKEVNMIGAACINAVLNISAQGEIPYVFGGDGATLLTPPHRVDACKKTLLGVRHLAEAKFNLSLRVGLVPVARINASDRHKVMVAKYQISPSNVLATFSGGGIELAERWIKSNSDYLITDTHDDEPPDLSGLSCRWEPLASENGVMLSILMQAIADNEGAKARLYGRLIDAIGEISAEATNEGKPICDNNMRFRWPPRGLGSEIDATVGGRSRIFWALRLYLYSLFQWLLDRFDLTVGGYRGRQYRVELRGNTDYRRFDDTLRILLDCTVAQADEIEKMLAVYAGRGELVYGLHRADSALMTCLVFNLEKGEHIHFVDGNDGGFTSAAKNLKASQLA
ncbi:MAG: DUF3095 domain-containing protein [Gammaproteobacteria bacterium]